MKKPLLSKAVVSMSEKGLLLKFISE